MGIPEEGKGWKIFMRIDGKLEPLTGGIPYDGDPHKGVSWKKEVEVDRGDYGYTYNPDGDGFCFLMTRKEARALIKRWKQLTSDKPCVRRIEYKGGLEKHVESGITRFDEKWLTGLCTWFRVIDG
jgi:hypothetical protein